MMLKISVNDTYKREAYVKREDEVGSLGVIISYDRQQE